MYAYTTDTLHLNLACYFRIVSFFYGELISGWSFYLFSHIMRVHSKVTSSFIPTVLSTYFLYLVHQYYNRWKHNIIETKLLRAKIRHHLKQREPTGGPRAMSGPRLLVIRSAKLFVSLLPLTSLFILFAPKHLKKS